MLEEKNLEKDVQYIMLMAKKQGTISEDEIGEKLIKYDLSSDELREIVEQFKNPVPFLSISILNTNFFFFNSVLYIFLNTFLKL